MKRVHVYVSGKVQGVYYRKFTQENAEERGVNGWVRNLPDGRVEAVFEGEKESIQELLERCRDGPDMAVVENIKLNWGEPEGLDGFEIRR